MILYQIAKSMEEHKRLNRSIRESTDNSEQLIEEKAELEQAVLSQAMRWKATDPSVFA
mgnify:CR=1 FL=1